ncbi:hypothetical protein Patl1_29460 [Pistacia atlantica]|uniref:Uncharacterized protein n=1 Tax=Pistacia atlantica TaxID=434234 RepID=A0ACC1A8J4_9ROSI|nr:hypothetical protein Patl1_29460 [Pistacia atlantica]
MVMAMDLTLIAVTAILLVGEGNTQALPPLQPPIQSPQAACSDGDATVPLDLENSISLEKVVEMANDCGNPLKHGTQCGIYTVP